MNHKQFIRLPAERTSGGDYEAIVNHHLINFAVPSKSGQVGKTIVTLARGPQNRNTVGTKCDLDTLALKVSHLTPVQVYGTGEGKTIGPGLVNLSRVVEITEYEKFVNLAFVDGEEINVTNKLV